MNSTPATGDGSGGGIGGTGLDLNFVPVQEELSAQAKRFPLQDEVDEVNSLVRLASGPARSDLVRIELEIQPADGDGFHVGMVRASNISRTCWRTWRYSRMECRL